MDALTEMVEAAKNEMVAAGCSCPGGPEVLPILAEDGVSLRWIINHPAEEECPIGKAVLRVLHAPLN